MRTCVPEVPCELFDEVSHWLHLDQPEAVNEELDGFLASLKA